MIAAPKAALELLVSTDLRPQTQTYRCDVEHVLVRIAQIRFNLSVVPMQRARLQRIFAALRAGMPLPPIIIDSRGLLVDGHHRIAVALALGFTLIPAEVRR
jgi:hypothetical protein